MDEWLKDIHQAAFFTPDRGVVETCKYWTPSQDPSTDTPAEVAAVIKRSTQEASYSEHSGSVDHSGSAMIKRTLSITEGEPNDFGILEDANGEQWRINAKNGATAAYHLVQLTKDDAKHFGGVRTRD